jgi:hypothetical protein
MAQVEMHSWSGYTRDYSYEIHSLPYEEETELKGNYIFCKVVDGEWVPIYIGEGIIHNRIKDEDHYTCAIEKGATHVHVHIHEEDVAKIRDIEQADLLQKHSESYDPKGCNIRRGGRRIVRK